MANNQIALLAQAPVLDTPFESQGKALQLRQLMNAGQVQDMDMQQRRQAIADDAATRDVFSKYSDPAERIAALYKVSPKAAAAAEKAQLDNKETQAKTGHLDAQTFEVKQKAINLKMQQRKDLLNTVNDPQTAAQWVAGMFADPDLGGVLSHGGDTAEAAVARIPKDPQGFAKWKMETALNSDKLIEYTTPNANTVANNQTSIATNAATNATSIENNKRTVGASYANAGALREQAKATRDAANIQTGFANEQGLRKEFEGLPEVKNYKQAYPAFAAIKDASARNTTQSDINIVYGLAKLYDPNSVVREGEYATVANSPNIPEKVKGYAQYLAGGGKLSAETKRQILSEATGRIGTYEAEAKKAKGSYAEIAKKRGMDPASVFADMGDMGGNSAQKPNASAIPSGWSVKEQ